MMQPHYQDDAVTLYHGDCLDVLADLPDASVDSVVTDPPYELTGGGSGGFMGKKWDATGIAFNPFVWGHCLRVLKPGGHLLAFGGTRTWHRLAVAIEDAGFEIRDSLAWLTGQGFPKSLDVSKAIDKAAGAEREQVGSQQNWGASRAADGKQAYGDYAGEWSITAPATADAKRWAGWGTALKPAFEPCVVARKPLSGTVAANVLAHGVGALNIDACRVGTSGATKRSEQTSTKTTAGWTTGHDIVTLDAGRWPSNVVIDQHAAAEIDRQSGVSVSRDGGASGTHFSAGNAGIPTPDRRRNGHDDEGGASRFFPTFRYCAKASSSERPVVNGRAHETVKPLELVRWLVRLVTPPGGTVLEPFAGSGTTAEACIHEHMRCIAIEREADYLPLIVARLTKPIEIGFDFNT